MILKSQIFFGVLVLVVVVYISTMSYAILDDGSDEQPTRQMSFFDPFALRTIEPVTDSTSGLPVSGSEIILPPIRVPFRPVVRSPFRPPLASGR